MPLDVTSGFGVTIASTTDTFILGGEELRMESTETQTTASEARMTVCTGKMSISIS